MNFDEKNGLNFDFDTPIEEIEEIKISSDGDESFDLAMLTSSNSKNSALKRNRINEDIIKDRTIEREQEIFDLNRERHSAQNASVRTAPHAITAEELMRSKSKIKRNDHVNIEEEILENADESDLKPITEKSYSNAAHQLFEKLRNRKSEVEIADESNEFSKKSQVVSETETVNVNDVSDDDIGADDNTEINNEALVLEDLFNIDMVMTDDESEVNFLDDEQFENEHTNKEISDIDDNTDAKADESADMPTLSFDVNEIYSEENGDDYNGIENGDIPVQSLFIHDSEDDDVYQNADFSDGNQYSFDSASFDINDESSSYDGFVDENLIDIVEFDNEGQNTAEFELFNGEELDFDDEADEDVGFDLPELEHTTDDEFYDMPSPIIDDFDGLDDEILSDISPRNDFANRLDTDYLGSVEYNDLDDDYDVSVALNKEKHSSVVKMALSFAIALISLCLSVGVFVSSDFFGTMGYWISSVLLGIILLVVNFSSSKSIIQIKDNDFRVDLLPTTLAISAVVQGIIGLLSVNVGNIGFTVVAAVIFGLFNLAKYIRVCDIIKNFDLICNDEEKNVVSFIEKPESNKIIDGSDDIDYRIAYQKKTFNITDFIKNSISLGVFEKNVKRFYIGAVIAALIFSAVFAVSANNAGLAVFGLSFGLAIASPISALVMTIVSIRRINGTLRNYRVKLFGFGSAENIDNTNVVTVNANDLFSKNNVKLYNIKTFGGLSLDRAIIDASSLLTAANSPMMNIFNDIAKDETIPQTDSVTYEDRMGLSGWVGGRKTLIGNRMIMETHGIEVPPIDVDKKIIMNGYFPVYMSSEGKLSALFVVGYNADPALSYYIKKIFNLGLTLLVKTCDPNITEDMVANYFGIDRDSVVIASHESEILMDKANTLNAATFICDNSKGYLNGIISSINLVKYSKYAVIAQIIITALAFMIFGISAAMGYFGIISYISLIIYNLISLGMIYIFNLRYV